MIDNNRPEYYGGESNEYEPFKVFRHLEILGDSTPSTAFNLLNALKYLSRLGKKSDKIESDLSKALTYLKQIWLYSTTFKGVRSPNFYNIYSLCENWWTNYPETLKDIFSLSDFSMILETIWNGNLEDASSRLKNVLHKVKEIF